MKFRITPLLQKTHLIKVTTKVERSTYRNHRRCWNLEEVLVLSGQQIAWREVVRTLSVFDHQLKPNR